MLNAYLRTALFAFLLLPGAAAADPIKLKLSFFTSDRSIIYQNSIKPFVDAVNAEGKDVVKIDVYFSGAITKVQAAQPQLVLDGTADLAIVVPAQSPELFGDNAILELPGLYRGPQEATDIYRRLIEAKALQGYDDFFVIGAFISQGENIHGRKPIASNADLKGLLIRTNNKTESTTLEGLGAIPVQIAINQTTEAMSRGNIDAATFPPSLVFEFGVGRVTSHHYMLQLGGVPFALVMNRGKFESLPLRAQAIIRKYSGKWLSDRSVASYLALDGEAAAKLESDPLRTVTQPSPSDTAAAENIFKSVDADWAAQSQHNRELLALVNADLVKIRSGN